MFDIFWDNCFEEAIKLKEKFKLIETKKWNSLLVMDEFEIQLGHYALIESGDEIAKEKGRNIENRADEICDILLQLCTFCKFENIKIEEINFQKIEYHDEKNLILDLMSISGQIIETILETKKYRFNKSRNGFLSHKSFIIDRISKLFSIIFSIVEYRKIDIVQEFHNMCKDASLFIDRKLNEYKYPIVDLHASWIALNPIQGCPNSCKYCFLNGVNLTKTNPKILATPEETVKELKRSKFYHQDIPICIETESDGFATPVNIAYVEALLDELEKNNVFNLIVFITKCSIPLKFIAKVRKMQTKGYKFIFFLSYSGLDNDIEIGVKKENIKRNFVELYKNNIPVVHYWRPFLPQNSSEEKIREVYNFVKKYAKCSVAIGLKVKENYKDKLDFWKEIKDAKETTCAESVWTKEAYDLIWGEKSIIDEDYPIFKTTSCAIGYATNRSEQEACFNTNVCENDNKCPQKQRELCKKFYRCLNKIDVKYVENLLKRLNLINDKTVYKITINNTRKIIEIQGISLNTKEFSMLTLLTKYRIKAQRNNSDDYWNSFINDAKQIIV